MLSECVREDCPGRVSPAPQPSHWVVSDCHSEERPSPHLHQCSLMFFKDCLYTHANTLSEDGFDDVTQTSSFPLGLLRATRRFSLSPFALLLTDVTPAPASRLQLLDHTLPASAPSALAPCPACWQVKLRRAGLGAGAHPLTALAGLPSDSEPVWHGPA